jgi:formiminotetrahydrofolate cyclodeaminase
MEDSVWTTTLAAFREKASGTDPVPASVAISAVTASLALALLAKVLNIVSRRKNFTGDRQRLDALLDAARAESTSLTHLADDDIEAFNQYMECVRRGKELGAAIRKTIEVPMDCARSAVRGLGLCAQTAGMVQGLAAADIGAAAALLSGAARAMLLSVDANIRELCTDPRLADATIAERHDLEREALRQADAVAATLNAQYPGTEKARPRP